MELKDFIKGTISNISLAIIELNEEMNDKGLIVNPKDDSNRHNDCTRLNYSDDWRMVKDIEFNVSLSVSDGKDKGLGFKIVLNPALNIGGNYGSNNNNSVSNSVKFCIPVVYPGAHAYGKQLTTKKSLI